MPLFSRNENQCGISLVGKTRAFQAQVVGSFPSSRSIHYTNMQKRYRSYPAVDAALVETRSRFGIGIQHDMITDEMREIASRFDVEAEIKKAELQRSAFQKTVV